MILHHVVYTRRGMGRMTRRTPAWNFSTLAGASGDAAIPGHQSTRLLLDTESEPGVTELTLLALWESTESSKAFAGDDIGRAVYYPADDGLLLEKPERLRHYTVVRAPAFAS